jgi:hypothetical protein
VKPAPPFKAVAVAASLLLAALVAACGSTPSTSGPTTSTQATSGAGATAAVGHSYATLFDLADPAVAPKLAVVQDGSSLRAAFDKDLALPLAKEATGATVSTVTVESGTTCSGEGLPAPCASVEYDILSASHKPLFPAASKGWAVYDAGHWLVAKVTICGLLSLAGPTPTGC